MRRHRTYYSTNELNRTLLILRTQKSHLHIAVLSRCIGFLWFFFYIFFLRVFWILLLMVQVTSFYLYSFGYNIILKTMGQNFTDRRKINKLSHQTNPPACHLYLPNEQSQQPRNFPIKFQIKFYVRNCCVKIFSTPKTIPWPRGPKCKENIELNRC